MRILALGLLSLVGACSVASTSGRPGPEPAAGGVGIVCAPASSGLARSFREGIESLLSDSDSLAIATRQRWGVPVMAAEEISLETDRTTCRRGFDAYRAAWAGADSTAQRVIVLNFRDRRAILVEPRDFGIALVFGHMPTLVTDRSFNSIDLDW